MKNHSKRASIPTTWGILKKANTFVKRPNSGMMELPLSISINTVLTELTKICRNNREVKFLLTKNKVLVDGKRRKDDKFAVSFGSPIDVNGKQYFRLTINKKGRLDVKEISKAESQLKIVKLVNKYPTKKGLQLSFSDGRNVVVKSTKLNTRDSVLIKLPEQKVEKEIPFKKGNLVFVHKGKNSGKTAVIEEYENKKLIIKTEDGLKETRSEYAIVIGEKKPEITV